VWSAYTMSYTTRSAGRAGSKRTHGADQQQQQQQHGGGVNTDSDGFTEFNSRYSKRRCQRQDQRGQQQPLQSGGNQQSGQPRRADNHAVNQQRSGQQQSGKPQSTQQSQIQGKSNKFSALSQLYDEVIESVASQPDHDQIKGVQGIHDSVQVTSLKNQVQELKDQVQTLKQQLEFVMSYVGINDCISQLLGTPNHPASQQSYAAAVAPKLSAPIRNAIVSAVHSDLKLKLSRSCNIVVTGLPHHKEQSDAELFVALCGCEFDWKPNAVRVKRLGEVRPNRLQPLLVILRSAEEAGQLLDFTRNLRHSTDEYTRRSIFFSPHQTRAERQAAYEARCRRRQRQDATRQQENEPSAAQSAARSDRRHLVARRSRDVRQNNGPTEEEAMDEMVGRLDYAEGDVIDAHRSGQNSTNTLRYGAADFAPTDAAASTAGAAAAAVGMSGSAAPPAGP